MYTCCCVYRPYARTQHVNPFSPPHIHGLLALHLKKLLRYVTFGKVKVGTQVRWAAVSSGRPPVSPCPPHVVQTSTSSFLLLVHIITIRMMQRRYDLGGLIPDIAWPHRLLRLSFGDTFNGSVEGVRWPPRLEVS